MYFISCKKCCLIREKEKVENQKENKTKQKRAKIGF